MSHNGAKCKFFDPRPDQFCERRHKTVSQSSSEQGPPRAIATPCVKVCIVDGASGLCLGCYRTLPEIGRWSRLTDEERRAVMDELPSRRGRLDPALLG